MAASLASRATFGYRWFLVMALGLVQLLLAPMMYIPWLPADKVLVQLDSAWPWILWVLLTAVMALSAAPLDRLGLSWVRFASALVQGLVVGHVIVFDLSTLLARFTFAAVLGAANALDRVAAIQALRSAMREAASTLVVGSSGVLDRDGKSYAVTVTRRDGGQVTVSLDARPYWFASSNAVTLQSDDPCLQILAPPQRLVESVVERLAAPSFQVRPWGYSLGVTLAQWMISGVNNADSFVAGMLTQNALIIFSVPIVFAIVWLVGTTYADSSYVGCFCACLAFGLCVLEFVAFLPLVFSVVGFAIVELVAHEVVAFISIPCDVLLFIAIAKVTAEELAASGLTRIFLRGSNLLASKLGGSSAAAVGDAPARAPLLG